MSRRRLQRRADKARRHLQPTHEPRSFVEQLRVTPPPRVVVREADHFVRLAYTRSQAAAALGISRSTLRRLLPYVDTIEMPWGGRLIPVDELERLAVERRRTARPRLEAATRGRKPTVPSATVKRIRDERSAGKSLRQIADDLNTDGVPTAHGGKRWWSSTVRAVLVRGQERPGSLSAAANGE
ncbi:MAG TPA: recombinase family protein [Gaiellaceae bacterium]